jgi:hypothetical protein
MAGDPPLFKSKLKRTIPKHIKLMLHENEISDPTYFKRLNRGWTPTRAAGADV